MRTKSMHKNIESEAHKVVCNFNPAQMLSVDSAHHDMVFISGRSQAVIGYDEGSGEQYQLMPHSIHKRSAFPVNRLHRYWQSYDGRTIVWSFSSAVKQRRWWRSCRKKWTIAYSGSGVGLVRPRCVVRCMTSWVVSPRRRRQLRWRRCGRVAVECRHADSTATRHRTLSTDIAAAAAARTLASTEQVTKTGA